MDGLDIIKKKGAARLLRERKKIIFPGAICHITQRAPGREPLFLEESDYLYMLYLIKNKSKSFNLDVFSFALMLNHIHLLIRMNEGNLSSAMKEIFETYAKFFNKKYVRKGHVFCGNYRCSICLDDSYIITASLYIHLNPLRAGLVNDPLEYRWSSCALFVKPIIKETFVNYEFILKILAQDINKGYQMYRLLLHKMSGIKLENIIEKPNALDGIKINLYSAIKETFKQIDEKRLQQLFSFSNLELEEKIKELKEKGRLRSAQDLKARKFLIEQMISRGFTVPEISNMLGITRQSVYLTLNFTK